MKEKRLLLLSNASVHGCGPLDHCAEEIKAILEDVSEIFFVPFAVHSSHWEAYTKMIEKRFDELFKVKLRSILDMRSETYDPDTIAFLVGGGNTFRLLNLLHNEGLTGLIARKVLEGTPYIGWSAGSNVACPTIKTTNDMPIVQPQVLEAMAMVPFQINVHYLDTDPESTHMGETREKRLAEFHEENEAPVIGLRERSWLSIEGEHVTLGGTTGAVLFRKGYEPTSCTPNSDLTKLLCS